MKKIIFKLLKLKQTPYQKTKKIIKKRLSNGELDSFEEWLNEKLLNKDFIPLDAYRILFSLLKDTNLEYAIKYGEMAQKIVFDHEMEKVLENRKHLLVHNKNKEIKYKIKQYGVQQLIEFYKTNSIKDVEKWIEEAVEIRKDSKLQLYKTLFNIAKNDYPKVAVYYGQKAIIYGVDKEFEKVVLTRERWLKNSKTINFDNSKHNVSLKEIKKTIDMLLKESIEKTIEYIKSIESYCDDESIYMSKIYLIQKINKTNILETITIGLSIIDKLDKENILKILAARAYAIKDYKNALVFYKKYYDLSNDNIAIDRIIISLSNMINVEDMTRDNYKSFVHEFIVDYFNEEKPLLDAKLAFYLLKRTNLFDETIINGLKVVELENNTKISLEIAKLMFKLGRISDAIQQTNKFISDEKHKNLNEIYNSYLKLLKNGFSMPEAIAKKSSITNKKILYVINNSLPYHSNGYATRAHGLLKGVQEYDNNVHAITRLGYPHDLVKFRNYPKLESNIVDDILYSHLPSDYWLNYMPLEEYITYYGEKLVEYAKEHNIGILHSASNFVNGLAANYAAKKLGIKSIYEVRGLWEITRISKDPEWINSEHFDMIKKLETEAAIGADCVFTITNALKTELIDRGVEKNKIEVLPNGVDIDTLIPKIKNQNLMDKLAIKSTDTIIGYIGSIVDYEGIDILIKALGVLRDKNISQFKFILVGDGQVLENIKYLVKELNLEDFVIITGRIPHEEVEEYYSLVDIAPLPRKGLPVCEMVSPLKPFEAMAMEKVVLASDVAALAEIVEDDYNGMLFQKDNIEDLADKIEILINNPALRERLGKQAREWVLENRDWKHISSKLNDSYKKLLEMK